MSFGIVLPEVISLCIRISYAGIAHTEIGPVCQRRPAQIGPIPPLSASDNIVDSGRGKVLMI
jgi:hypothetical protein